MAGGLRNSSSSDEYDADPEWRTAIDSVVAAVSDGCRPPAEERLRCKSGDMTLHRMKAQKLLDKMLERNIEFVRFERVAPPPLGVGEETNEGGLRLLRNFHLPRVCDASAVVTAAHTGTKRRPRIAPGEELGENSKKFQQQVESAAVEGGAILACARAAARKSLCKLEAAEAGAETAASREEERVAQLRKMRGERWLPAMRF